MVWQGARHHPPSLTHTHTHTHTRKLRSRIWRALVNTFMSFRVPIKADTFLTTWTTVSFSRITLSMDLISPTTFEVVTPPWLGQISLRSNTCCSPAVMVTLPTLAFQVDDGISFVPDVTVWPVSAQLGSLKLNSEIFSTSGCNGNILHTGCNGYATTTRSFWIT